MPMTEHVPSAAGRFMEPWGEAAYTHSAVVYFAGDRAYKLKRPVSLGFLDLSTGYRA
jgi:aminoglycoside phosphotransferase family enzyme